MINLQKNNLRKYVLKKRNLLSPNFIKEKSSAIENILFDTDEFKKADKIFIYYSFKNETYTLNIIKKALSMGKTIALPLVKEDCQMDFFKVKSLTSLKKGAFGIPEPYPDSEKLEPDKKTLVITPGVVFDVNKNRIGMGKGFYDRYFQKYRKINFQKIGLCYDFQIVESLPADKYDVPLNKIISEKGVIE